MKEIAARSNILDPIFKKNHRVKKSELRANYKLLRGKLSTKHDDQLNQVLKIKKGDTYNGIELEKRIADFALPQNHEY